MSTALTQLLIFRFPYLVQKGQCICIDNSDQPLQATTILFIEFICFTLIAQDHIQY